VEYHTELLSKVGLYRTNGIHIKIPIYLSEPDENGHVLLLLADSDELIDYCLETQSYEVIARNGGITGSSTADYDGRYIWLFKQMDKDLLRWDVTTGGLNEYPLEPTGFLAPEDRVKFSVFSGLVDCGDYLLLFPAFANMIVRFDKKSETFSQYTEMPVPGENDIKKYKYGRPKRIENIVYAFSRYNNTIYRLDTTNGTVTAHSFAIDFASDDKTINCLRYHMEIENASPDGDAGEKIYRYVKKASGS
jgi:hypothetical protein